MYIAIYYADTAPLQEEPLFSKALARVPAQRREKIGRCRFVSDKALSLGAGLLLMETLRDLVPGGGRIEAELLAGRRSISYGEQGKPYLPGVPDFHFSITHSGRIAALAVSDAEIGCDLEQIRTPDLLVARRLFSEEEKERLTAAGTKEEQEDLFFRLWTLRESFLKVTGKGLRLSMRDFAISLENGSESDSESSSTVRVLDTSGELQEVGRPAFSFAEPVLVPGYRFALCRAGASCTPSVREVDFSAGTEYLQ